MSVYNTKARMSFLERAAGFPGAVFRAAETVAQQIHGLSLPPEVVARDEEKLKGKLGPFVEELKEKLGPLASVDPLSQVNQEKIAVAKLKFLQVAAEMHSKEDRQTPNKGKQRPTSLPVASTHRP